MILCTVNGNNDGGLCYKEFIGVVCILIKKTKAGLYQVAQLSDQRQVVSVPKYNISPLNKAELMTAQESITRTGY